MADGELVLKLDDETMRRLQAEADAAGQSMGDYAASLIADQLSEHGWAEALDRLAEYDRTGESISVEEALQHFDATLRDRQAARR
jgi:predicted transcriptional regulator